MGCGASADNKSTVQTVPLSQVQNSTPLNPPLNSS